MPLTGGHGCRGKKMAEVTGFEPATPCGATAFEAASSPFGSLPERERFIFMGRTRQMAPRNIIYMLSQNGFDNTVFNNHFGPAKLFIDVVANLDVHVVFQNAGHHQVAVFYPIEIGNIGGHLHFNVG